MARQLVEQPAAAGERRLKMTYEEWLDWADEDIRSEWVGGEVIEFMPATPRHQRAMGLFHALLLWYVGRFDLGQVFIAGLSMRLANAAREPDVVFVAKKNLARIEPTRLLGPADLVMEVVSDDSVARDQVEKFAQYAAAGVPEYWLCDPRPGEEWAKLYALTAVGRYDEVPPDEQGRLQSRVVPGFWLDPAWLWQDPPPALHSLQETIAAG